MFKWLLKNIVNVTASAVIVVNAVAALVANNIIRILSFIN